MPLTTALGNRRLIPPHRAILECADQPIAGRPQLGVNEVDDGLGGLPAGPKQEHCLGNLCGLIFHDFAYLSHGLKPIMWDRN
jgi:hypothetical protein